MLGCLRCTRYRTRWCHDSVPLEASLSVVKDTDHCAVKDRRAQAHLRDPAHKWQHPHRLRSSRCVRATTCRASGECVRALIVNPCSCPLLWQHLSENGDLLEAAYERMNLGRLHESLQYQYQLQQNLIYLATHADEDPNLSKLVFRASTDDMAASDAADMRQAEACADAAHESTARDTPRA